LFDKLKLVPGDQAFHWACSLDANSLTKFVGRAWRFTLPDRPGTGLDVRAHSNPVSVPYSYIYIQGTEWLARRIDKEGLRQTG